MNGPKSTKITVARSYKRFDDDGEFDFDLVINELTHEYFDEVLVLCVFAGSVVFMTLLLLNLFIGLVTADIERIKQNARYESARMKIDYILIDSTRYTLLYTSLRALRFTDRLATALHRFVRRNATEQTIRRADLPPHLQTEFDRAVEICAGTDVPTTA